ncbi:MAG: hypothetical protein II913_02480, partial [Elusimicrobiaceae bacterium]|nr:hypothetical protein [Elusimicrobiaceae bacterium]
HAKFIVGLEALNQEDYEQARQAWMEAVQLDPDNLDADLALRKVEEMLKLNVSYVQYTYKNFAAPALYLIS